MHRFTENIDNQIEFNQGKNIFLDNLDIFQFTKETVKAISNIDRMTPDSKLSLLDYATDKAIEEFCRVNQYYSFDLKAKNNLRKIYADLIENLQTKTNSVENISKNHYEKLKSWLKENNPFAEKVFKSVNEKVSPVACSEYSPKLQIDILQIDVKHLMQPVLDIGCGINGHLVNYLKDQEIEVLGIDRFKFTTSNFMTADWLEYDYGKEKWGTIVSNLGFSNHFNHHNLREDGNYIEYGKTYMNILNSLKVGGCFHYAPNLPFIEKYLDNNQFDLKKNEINEYDFKTTVINKIKRGYPSYGVIYFNFNHFLNYWLLFLLSFWHLILISFISNPNFSISSSLKFSCKVIISTDSQSPLRKDRNIRYFTLMLSSSILSLIDL